MPIERTKNEIRIRIESPKKFSKSSFRRIELSGKRGIYAIVGCPKGFYSHGRCRTSTRVQSFRFKKPKGWTKKTAESWVKKHKR